MINELSSSLITGISTFVGTGGLASLFLWRHNRKMRDLEAQLKSAEVSKAKIEGKTDEWHLYKEQLDTANQRIIDLLKVNAEKEDRHQQDIKDWEERFTNQTTYLRSVQRDLIAANEREKNLIQKIGLLLRRIQYLTMWICKRGDCDHGEPPRERLSGHVFDNSQTTEIDKENDTPLT